MMAMLQGLSRLRPREFSGISKRQLDPIYSSIILLESTMMCSNGEGKYIEKMIKREKLQNNKQIAKNTYKPTYLIV